MLSCMTYALNDGLKGKKLINTTLFEINNSFISTKSQNGKLKVQMGLYGSLFSSTMDPAFVKNCIRCELDSMGIAFQVKKYKQGLKSCSDLAIISCHVDVDPENLKKAGPLIPFLWVAEVMMWKNNQNLKYKAEPHLSLHCKGATYLQAQPAKRWLCQL